MINTSMMIPSPATPIATPGQRKKTRDIKKLVELVFFLTCSGVGVVTKLSKIIVVRNIVNVDFANYGVNFQAFEGGQSNGRGYKHWQRPQLKRRDARKCDSVY